MNATRAQLISKGNIKPTLRLVSAAPVADKRAIEARKHEAHVISATDKALAVLRRAVIAHDHNDRAVYAATGELMASGMSA